jgi:hypothetical protein
MKKTRSCPHLVSSRNPGVTIARGCCGAQRRETQVRNWSREDKLLRKDHCKLQSLETSKNFEPSDDNEVIKV